MSEVSATAFADKKATRSILKISWNVESTQVTTVGGCTQLSLSVFFGNRTFQLTEVISIVQSVKPEGRDPLDLKVYPRLKHEALLQNTGRVVGTEISLPPLEFAFLVDGSTSRRR